MPRAMTMPVPDRPRVLFVTSNLPRWRGDATTPFILHLAQDLQGLGWEVGVLAPHAPGAELRERLDGVAVERFRYLWPASWQTVCYQGGALLNLERDRLNAAKLPFLVAAELGAVLRRLARGDLVLVHSHWMLPQGFVASLAARPLRVPHVLTVHGSDAFALDTRLLRRFKRSALRGASAVTVNSSATERAVRSLGVPLPSLHRISMGVAERPLDEAQRRRARALRARHRRAAGPLLVFIGRIAEEKGCTDLITAVALLRDAGSDATLLVIGEGPDRAEAERLTGSLGAGDRVTFTGWVDHDEIPSVLAAADILVAPSCRSTGGRIEAQGIVLAEAMMAGTPVIASGVGGIGDFVRHRETGWLVGERAPWQIAEAVRRLHADPAMSAGLASRARLYASRHLSRDRTARAFHDLYSGLLARDAGAAFEQAAAAGGDPVRILVLRHRSAPERTYGGPAYTASVMALLAEGPLRASVRELAFEGPPSATANRLRVAWAGLRSLTSALPSKVLRFRSRGFRRRLRRAMARERFDLVLVSGIEMLWCLPQVARQAPAAYLCHNLEGSLFRQQIRRRALPVSWLAARDAAKLAAFEREWVARSAAVIGIAPRETAALSSMAPQIPVITVPPTFDHARPAPGDEAGAAPGSGIRLGFLGNLAWWPNRAGLDWFLSEVWPELSERYALHLFGNDSERWSSRPRLVGHGYVQNLGRVWQTVQVFVQPVVVRAGLNVKVAEAAYMRLPMIATPAALEGCGLAPDPAIVVAAEAKDWIDYLSGPGPNDLIGRRVSRTNADRFARAGHAARLAAFLRAVMAGERAGVGAPP